MDGPDSFEDQPGQTDSPSIKLPAKAFEEKSRREIPDEDWRKSSLSEKPPPAYSEATTNNHTIASDVKIPLHSETSASSPSLAQPGQAATRTLHIWYNSWKNCGVRVLDVDKSTELYNVKIAMFSPHIRIHDAGTTGSSGPIGTVIYHCTKGRMDCMLRGSELLLKSCGMLKNGHAFASKALGGTTLTWKTKLNSSLDLVCTDEQGGIVARFRFSNWSFKKAGKMELMGSHAANGPLMEELLVTGMAKVEYVLSLRYTAIAVA